MMASQRMSQKSECPSLVGLAAGLAAREQAKRLGQVGNRIVELGRCCPKLDSTFVAVVARRFAQLGLTLYD